MPTSNEPKQSPDLSKGSFTENGPWDVSGEPEWKAGLKVLRRSTRRQVPLLTKPRRIPPLRRFVVVVARLAWALGSWALIGRRKGGEASRLYLAVQIRRAAEKLGPTYIKLCQILSSGEGLFPPELVEEMKKCRDKVPAQTWEQVEAVVVAELGCPISNVFESFDREPIAAASIAQVHRAKLRLEDGTTADVVVKVQRQGIRALVTKDLQVMATIAPALVGRIPVAALANPPALVELFAETITEELDFRLEAENMLDLAGVLGQLSQGGYVVPRPHPKLVTRRMLVMERFVGFEFDDVEGMTAAGIDTHEVIRVGMRGFTEGCMIHGIFHGDLHGGNLMVLEDGRIGLLDYGICARMTSVERIAFLKLMLAGAVGDIPTQVEAFRDLGALPPDTDIAEIISDLGLDQQMIDPTTMEQQELVGEIQRITKALIASGARLPKILMLYVKNLVFLDGAIARLAPELDLLTEFADLSAHLATNYGTQIAQDLGTDPSDLRADKEAIKASFGINDPEMDTLNYSELQRRRELIRQRLTSGK